MKRVRPTGSITTPGSTRLRRAAMTLAATLAASLVATLVGCGTDLDGPGADATPPSLALSGVRDGEVRSDGELAFDVLASDPSGVSAVTWTSDHGDAGDCAPAGGDAYACGPVPLPAGATTITVRARDTLGNARPLTFTAIRDATPPSLTVSGLADGATVETAHVEATATSSDDRSVSRVTWSTDAGNAGTCVRVSDDDYACGPVPLVPGANTVTFTAEDEAGNRAVVDVEVTYAAPADTDVTPPTLSVSGVTDGATVDTAQVWATVTSVDDRSFPTVTWSTDAGDDGACPWIGGDDHDCGPIPLAEGDTTITFRAEDAAGNAATASYLVTYAPDAGASGFEIEIVFFDESFTASQLDAFQAAADRWESIVVGDLEGFPLDQPANGSCNVGEPAYSGTVDDLLIFATSFTDAPGGLLGSAGPCLSRSSGADTGTNAVGFMRFDTEDLAVLESDGDLVETIVHEMGHVLGIGTNWEFLDYYQLLDYEPDDGVTNCSSVGSFTVPPTYVGAQGIDAWHELGGSGAVPVEDGGGLGTRCGHWDDETFDDELMTGFLNSGALNPLSRLTVRSLRDIGLTVDTSAADPYTLPTGAPLRTQAGFDIAAAEILVPARGTIDPATGEIDIFPGR